MDGLTGTDPGYPVGGANPIGGADVRRGRYFYQKRMRRQKKLGLVGVGERGCPLDPLMIKEVFRGMIQQHVILGDSKYKD